jgi:hypothetical protein
VAEQRRERNARRPGTFSFLGFTHYCGWSRDGRFVVKRRTEGRRVSRKLQEVQAELRRRMHTPVQTQHRWLCSVLRGHDAYYGLPSNWSRLDSFHNEVRRRWYGASGVRPVRSATVCDGEVLPPSVHTQRGCLRRRLGLSASIPPSPTRPSTSPKRSSPPRAPSRASARRAEPAPRGTEPRRRRPGAGGGDRGGARRGQVAPGLRGHPLAPGSMAGSSCKPARSPTARRRAICR